MNAAPGRGLIFLPGELLHPHGAEQPQQPEIAGTKTLHVHHLQVLMSRRFSFHQTASRPAFSCWSEAVAAGERRQ
jgi:hypothetical protein